jgi:hypothetical protein
MSDRKTRLTSQGFCAAPELHRPMDRKQCESELACLRAAANAVAKGEALGLLWQAHHRRGISTRAYRALRRQVLAW